MRPPGSWLAFKTCRSEGECFFNKRHKRHQTMLWTCVKLQSEAGPHEAQRAFPFCVLQGNLCCIMGFFDVLLDLVGAYKCVQ